jgi:hypothetical protein
MKKVLATVLALALTTPAMAWGDREQGVLAGIAATLFFQHMQQHSHTQGSQPPVVIQQQPVIVQPPAVPVVVPPTIQLNCVPSPNHDYHGRVIGYAYICR